MVGDKNKQYNILNFTDIDAERQINLMRQMIHKSPIAKAVINKDLVICGTNKKLCEETGYHPFELYNEPITKILKKENEQKHKEVLNKWFESPLEMRLKIAEQLYTVGKDGHETKVRIDIYPLEIWEKNTMIQVGEKIRKPEILACLAIVIDD